MGCRRVLWDRASSVSKKGGGGVGSEMVGGTEVIQLACRPIYSTAGCWINPLDCEKCRFVRAVSVARGISLGRSRSQHDAGRITIFPLPS